MEKFNSVLTYTLNKFCPISIVSFICFAAMGFNTWEPYIVCGLMYFAQEFHYKIGYSVALCEERGILEK